ncbi:MAG TPA: hypothetical protein VNO22_13930 [Planctomycetota bacterium]|nr:hypothetical protein [Planctomycetota bacterium]
MRTLAILAAAALTAAQEDGPPVLLTEDFEGGAARWEPTDPAAWKIVETPSGKIYSQFRKSAYEPPHRSPLNIALLKDVVVGDFVLEARVRSTARDYNHRDVCVIFGYQDPARFYYTHLGKKADDHAHQIFIVNGAPRRKISSRTTEGTPWTDGWHRIRVTRRVSDGRIEVFFDDFSRPVQTAEDRTFAWGRVGLGTFDDTADWDDVVLRGVRVEPPPK